MRTRVGVMAVLALLVASITTVGSPRVSHAQDASESFRIVVIPDTQRYATSDVAAAVAQAQADWVAAQAADVAFATHVGDVVEEPNDAIEWGRLEPMFDTLELAGVPYGISPGNHDLSEGGLPVLFDDLFPLSRFEAQPSFRGNHADEGFRSTYYEVTAGEHDLLFVQVRHLLATYGDLEPVMDWLDGILGAHPDHLVFVTTHQFTETDGSIVITELRDAVMAHCNVAMVLSGHRLGESVRGTFDDNCGRTVTHLMTNYQFIQNGGDGFLRTLDIDPYSLQVTSQVYSPTLEQFREGPDEAFVTGLAKLVPVAGDANCDRVSDIVDALVIAQFRTGSRTDHGSCPLPAASFEIDGTAADINGDEQVDIVDALLIAQCSSGIANETCPADNG